MGEVDATSSSSVCSVSVGITLAVIHVGNHVAGFDIEHVKDIEEDVELFAGIGIKMNHESR